MKGLLFSRFMCFLFLVFAVCLTYRLVTVELRSSSAEMLGATDIDPGTLWKPAPISPPDHSHEEDAGNPDGPSSGSSNKNDHTHDGAASSSEQDKDATKSADPDKKDGSGGKQGGGGEQGAGDDENNDQQSGDTHGDGGSSDKNGGGAGDSTGPLSPHGAVVSQDELLPFRDAIDVPQRKIKPTYYREGATVKHKKVADRVAKERLQYDTMARQAVERGDPFVFFPQDTVEALSGSDRERCLKRHFAEVRFRRGLVPLFFKHIQKASGTSICNLCSLEGLGWKWQHDRGFMGANCNPTEANSKKTILNQNMESLKENMVAMLNEQQTSIVASEFMLPAGFPTDYFPGFISLRNPFKQLISRFHTFDHFKRQLQQHPSAVEFYKGITISQLAGCLQAGNQPCPRAWKNGRIDMSHGQFFFDWKWPPPAKMKQVSSEAMLAHAAKLLNEWSVALVLERLSDGFPLLEWAFGFTNVSGTYPHLNPQNKKWLPPLEWPDWDDPQWREITETRWNGEYRLLDVAYRLLDVRAPLAQQAMDEGKFHFNNIMCHPYVAPRALPDDFPVIWPDESDSAVDKSDSA